MGPQSNHDNLRKKFATTAEELFAATKDGIELYDMVHKTIHAPAGTNTTPQVVYALDDPFGASPVVARPASQPSKKPTTGRARKLATPVPQKKLAAVKMPEVYDTFECSSPVVPQDEREELINRFFPARSPSPITPTKKKKRKLSKASSELLAASPTLTPPPPPPLLPLGTKLTPAPKKGSIKKGNVKKGVAAKGGQKGGQKSM